MTDRPTAAELSRFRANVMRQAREEKAAKGAGPTADQKLAMWKKALTRTDGRAVSASGSQADAPTTPSASHAPSPPAKRKLDVAALWKRAVRQPPADIEPN